MTHKCNFCERVIHFLYFGDDKIKCYCGAVYTKKVIVQLSVGKSYG